ncbi:MAG: ABC transporter substrate-binding protein [Bacteroidota bacterium]|nr:ABC transporter substrate-binding protein [Bacteroidota bacterium]
MQEHIDQTGKKIIMHKNPERIISLVPSQTELLFDLGLEAQVIGITKFCIHPTHWKEAKIIVGGTKNIHLSKIESLHPDLVIANKEENVKDQVESLEKIAPVWVSDINTLEEALWMIQSIGSITGTAAKASVIAQSIQENFEKLKPLSKPLRAAYLIWRQPYMAAGGATFINAMLKRCGLDNVFSKQQRYPVVTATDLQAADCQVILLSSEPYPFKEKHIRELQELLPQTHILLVDGEPFSWYGSRLLYAAAYFQSLLQQLTVHNFS